MLQRLTRLLTFLSDKRKVMRAYADVFSSPSGEIVLLHLMKHGNITKSSFTVGDPHLTSFEEGKRYMTLMILRYAGKSKNMLELLETLTSTQDTNENTDKHIA
jgi:hypothetical protein